MVEQERRREERRKQERRSPQGAGTWSGPERRKGERRRGAVRKDQQASHDDGDFAKGAVENDHRHGLDHVSMAGQLPHRAADERALGQDTDFPEPGQNPEHSGQRKASPDRGGRR